MKSVALALLFILPLVETATGCRSGAKRKETKTSMPAASIGSASMTGDGTIILDLRAEGPGGLTGDARLVYPRGHQQYREILEHIGGLRPGESKPVPPWPKKKRE
jgi:hypothetical protein